MIFSVDLRVFFGWSGYIGFFLYIKKLWFFCILNLFIYVIIWFEMKVFWKLVWDYYKEYLVCLGLSFCMGVLKLVVLSIVFKWNLSFKYLDEIV